MAPLLLWSSVVVHAGEPEVPPGSPNVLIVLLDDLGYSDYGRLSTMTRAWQQWAQRVDAYPLSREKFIELFAPERAARAEAR